MTEIRIVETERGYTVYQGDRFCEELCWDEMLSQVIELSHPKINDPHGRFGMRTDEESIKIKRKHWQAIKERESGK